ncbi:hypothetical protein BU26DRAFT_507887 [Trematosphaeria pertusa]|uniref:Uncharacterized protein n=1 Tax=Trematosphaeria pertusa TaxID=390896 RepID=A0A6A6I9S5_9PLEO|nr:uncharacterized protein BU26DRAFT_507887 [Trematosphaeria pertusa]KAF2246283.1 hypothetical protein BU26DRAFT_507887 [Trematosphaeria pertusa]
MSTSEAGSTAESSASELFSLILEARVVLHKDVSATPTEVYESVKSLRDGRSKGNNNLLREIRAQLLELVQHFKSFRSKYEAVLEPDITSFAPREAEAARQCRLYLGMDERIALEAATLFRKYLEHKCQEGDGVRRILPLEQEVRQVDALLSIHDENSGDA